MKPYAKITGIAALTWIIFQAATGQASVVPPPAMKIIDGIDTRSGESPEVFALTSRILSTAEQRSSASAALRKTP